MTRPYGIPRRQQALFDRKRRHRAIEKMRQHFIDRCRERVPEIDGARLFDEVCMAIGGGFDDLAAKICRVPGHNRWCWRVRIESGIYYVIWSERYLCPVTILPAGWTVRKWRRGKFKKLRDVA